MMASSSENILLRDQKVIHFCCCRFFFLHFVLVELLLGRCVSISFIFIFIHFGLYPSMWWFFAFVCAFSCWKISNIKFYLFWIYPHKYHQETVQSSMWVLAYYFGPKLSCLCICVFGFHHMQNAIYSSILSILIERIHAFVPILSGHFSMQFIESNTMWICN